MPRNNAPYLVGLATLVLVFFGVAWLTDAVAAALILGVLLGVAAIFITHGLASSSSEFDAYRADAQQRVKIVLDSVERIRQLASQLSYHKRAQREVLEEGCKTILDLMRLVQEKYTDSIAVTADRSNAYLANVEDTLTVAMTADRLSAYLANVEDIVTKYLKVQENPSYFDDAEQLTQRGEQGFSMFRDFALSRIREVNDGEILAYRAALDNMEPPELK